MGWFADFFNNPTLDQSKMTAKDNGKRKGDWLQPATEWVSNAIPNEFSKTNNQWTDSIPYVGWFLRGMAGADNFSETYSNTGDLGASAQYGASGFMGNAGDPYKYSPKNQAGLSSDWGSDWANNIGKMTNSASAAKQGNIGGATGILNQYDTNATGYYPMTGVGVGGSMDPNANKQSSSGIGGMGSILNMFGGSQSQQGNGGMGGMNPMNIFGGQQQQQPKSNSKDLFNAMMSSYIMDMMNNRSSQNSQQQSPQQSQNYGDYPTPYQPSISFGNQMQGSL